MKCKTRQPYISKQILFVSKEQHTFYSADCEGAAFQCWFAPYKSAASSHRRSLNNFRKNIFKNVCGEKAEENIGKKN